MKSTPPSAPSKLPSPKPGGGPVAFMPAAFVELTPTYWPALCTTAPRQCVLAYALSNLSKMALRVSGSETSPPTVSMAQIGNWFLSSRTAFSAAALSEL